MRWLTIILLLALLLPTIPLSAQTQLSEEEEALIERMFAAADKADTYTSFTATTTEFYIFEMQVSFLGQTVEFLESVTSNSDGYVIRDEDGERSSSTVTLAYDYRSPQDNSRYTIGADVITVDDMLYVNAMYTEISTVLPPIEPGWQMYNNAEDIPAALEELRLDEVFDSEEDTLFNRNLIRDSASEVTIKEGQLSDGTPVDVIQIVIEDDILNFLNLQASEDIFWQILEQAELEGEIIFTANLDADDNLLLTNISIVVSIDDLDLSELELEGFPVGTTLDLSVDTTQIGTISNIDSEYDAIVVPVDDQGE
ncbi:MAG: hypothetical protein L0154_26115 [Chloroflexi bacterium]|nr:hypothetical protein [Chloroflexota bacterium]